MNDDQILIENLQIYLEFVSSVDYHKLVQLARTDQHVKKFIDDIHMRYDTVLFFQDNSNYSRTVTESQQLVQIICDFMGYE